MERFDWTCLSFILHVHLRSLILLHFLKEADELTLAVFMEVLTHLTYMSYSCDMNNQLFSVNICLDFHLDSSVQVV